MKHFLAVFCLAALSGLAGAQTAIIDGKPGNIDAERAKISAERDKLEAGFRAEDAACLEKFAVNSCLRKVNTKRRQMIADLRRREISLNDEERRIKGWEQIRKTEEKSSPEKQQEAADRRAKATEDSQVRLDREKTKQQEKASASLGEKALRRASEERLMNSQKKARARNDRQAAAVEESKKYEDRQKQAQARRAQHERDQLGRSKPPAKSLPLPE